MVGVDPLSDAPVLRGDALQEVVVHVEAYTQREERELLPHGPLDVFLDGAQLDLPFESSNDETRVRRDDRRSKQKRKRGLLPTVGSPSDTRMIMETDRESMRPWLDALTSIWTALIRASLMLVPEVANRTSAQVLREAAPSWGCWGGGSPPLGLMFWMYFLASLTWMVDPGTRSSLQQRTLWLKSIMLK